MELTCFPPLCNWRWNQLFWRPTQSSWQSAFCYKWLRQISSHKYNFIWCAVIIIIIIGLTHLLKKKKKNDSPWSFHLLIVKTLPDENKELENFKPRNFIKHKNSLWKTIKPSGWNHFNTLYSSILHSVFAEVESSWQSYLYFLVLVTYLAQKDRIHLKISPSYTHELPQKVILLAWIENVSKGRIKLTWLGKEIILST